NELTADLVQELQYKYIFEDETTDHSISDISWFFFLQSLHFGSSAIRFASFCTSPLVALVTTSKWHQKFKKRFIAAMFANIFGSTTCSMIVILTKGTGIHENKESYPKTIFRKDWPQRTFFKLGGILAFIQFGVWTQNHHVGHLDILNNFQALFNVLILLDCCAKEEASIIALAL
ncbi:hypothetical protein ACJX0J_016367, partial [Zea mays]